MSSLSKDIKLSMLESFMEIKTVKGKASGRDVTIRYIQVINPKYLKKKNVRYFMMNPFANSYQLTFFKDDGRVKGKKVKLPVIYYVPNANIAKVIFKIYKSQGRFPYTIYRDVIDYLKIYGCTELEVLAEDLLLTPPILLLELHCEPKAWFSIQMTAGTNKRIVYLRGVKENGKLTEEEIPRIGEKTVREIDNLEFMERWFSEPILTKEEN